LGPELPVKVITTPKRAVNWISANQAGVGLALLAVVISLLWIMTAPPWRTPDEPAHFGYVQYLDREHSLPLFGRADYYPDELAALNRDNFSGIWGAPVTTIDITVPQVNPAGGTPPLYYWLVYPAFRLTAGGGIETQLYAMRTMGAAIFAMLALVSWRLARLLFPRQRYLQLGIPLLVVLHPQLGFITAGVITDGLLALLFTWFLYELAAFAGGDTGWKRAARLGLATGLGMLTKSSFLLAYPLGLAVLAVLLLRGRERQEPGAGSNSAAGWPVLARAAGMVLAVSLAVSGWFYLWSYIKTGGLEFSVPAPRYGASGWRDLLLNTTFRSDLFASFIGSFSWMSVQLPGRVIAWVWRAAELSVIGLMIGLLVGWRRRRWRVIDPGLAGAMAVVFALFVVAAAWFELKNGGAQGRYLFPAVFPFWTLFLTGLLGFFPPGWRARATALVVAAAGLISAWSLLVQYLPRVT
jgi:hypothetical protein